MTCAKVQQKALNSTAVSVYDLLKDTISGFTANNVVKNLDVDYVYRCIENVVFLYFLDNTTNTWTLMGISTRLGTRVTEIVDTITVDNYAALPRGYTKEFFGDYYDTYYNNVSYCYSRWKYDGPCTRTQIKSFSISGATGADAAIATISMVQPYFAGFSSGASRIAGFGEGTPQQDLPKGQNRRYADFGTVVESCSEKLPLSSAADFAAIRKGRGGCFR